MRCEGVRRSLNDLSQYYVMPWVLSNYESETIDLEDEANYRDLSKPMGAQLKERREVVQVSVRDVAHKQEKYDTLQSMYVDAPPDPSDPLHLLLQRSHGALVPGAHRALHLLSHFPPGRAFRPTGPSVPQHARSLPRCGEQRRRLQGADSGVVLPARGVRELQRVGREAAA